MALFESYERRIEQDQFCFKQLWNRFSKKAEKITKDAGLNVYDQIKGIQPICFENACWAYIVGAAIAIKKAAKEQLMQQRYGEGLRAFCPLARC